MNNRLGRQGLSPDYSNTCDVDRQDGRLHRYIGRVIRETLNHSLLFLLMALLMFVFDNLIYRNLGSVVI